MHKMEPLVRVMGVVFCAGALMLVAVPTQAQQCFPAPAGLVSWWPGDGDAKDLQGANNGTFVNGATVGAGLVAQGFSFDGVNDYVNVGDKASLDFGSATCTAPGFLDRTAS